MHARTGSSKLNPTMRKEKELINVRESSNLAATAGNQDFLGPNKSAGTAIQASRRKVVQDTLASDVRNQMTQFQSQEKKQGDR